MHITLGGFVLLHLNFFFFLNFDSLGTKRKKKKEVVFSGPVLNMKESE